MKKGISIDNEIHDFDKESLVTEPGGFDWWKCKKCGLRGKRYGLGSSIIQVSGKKSLIENCTGETKKEKNTKKNQVVEMKVPLPSYIHNFTETYHTIQPDGAEYHDYRCEKCGLTGRRYNRASNVQVKAKWEQIENCNGWIQSQETKKDKKEVAMPEVKDNDKELDVLEKAAEIVQAASTETEENPLLKKSTRDEFFEDVGIIEGLELAESLVGFSKLIKFQKFANNKKYRELGIKNFAGFCKQFGFSLSTGKNLRNQLKAFGVQGYKALSNAKLRQTDLNFLTSISDDLEIHKNKNGDSVIVIDGEEKELTPDNKDDIQAIIARLQLEKAEMKREAETATKEKDELYKKYQEIKSQLLEETKPGKEVETAQKVCQAYQDDFLRVITGLRKLYDKNPTNGQILELIVGTVFYIDNLNASLKTMLNMPFDTDTTGDIMTPEDILKKLGDEKED